MGIELWSAQAECCRKIGEGRSRKEIDSKMREKNSVIGITESSSWCRIDQRCFVACGSEPVLLVDAVEIFLRLLGSFRKSEKR
jgi:hypothetical protein